MDNQAVEILLVEDNPRDLDLTLRALKKNNLVNKVHIARDGQEAMDFLFAASGGDNVAKHPRPKLVLLDLKLPKIEGLDVLRRIKADEMTKMIPVVVLTSSREERDLAESYRLGVNSYIQKPVDFDKFLECAQELGLYWLLINITPD